MSQEEANRIVRAVERTRRAGLKVAIPTAAALGAGAALAIGAIPGGDGTITGCYVTNTDVISAYQAAPGELRVIDPSQPPSFPGGGPNLQATCVNGESTITWNQRGPQGPQGPPGAAGAAGAQGAAGRSLVGQTSFGFSGAGKTFLKLEGVDGESTVKDHKGDIDISSFSLGLGAPVSSGGGGGAGAGKTTFSSFSITKRLDKASPTLFRAAATGRHFNKATIVFARRSRGRQQDYLEFKMTDVLISSLQDGTSQGGSPSEQVTFKFAKIEEVFLSSSGRPLQSVAINVGAQKAF